MTYQNASYLHYFNTLTLTVVLCILSPPVFTKHVSGGTSGYLEAWGSSLPMV